MAVGDEETDVGVGVGAEVIGAVVVLFMVQATAIQVKEQSIKLKPSMLFTSASRAFEFRQHD